MEERAQLEKTLKPHWVWAIAFGSAVGWGCFVLPTDWISQAGPLGVIIGLGIGALLMVLIGVSYGILIQNFPVSGGEFTYAYLGFGRHHAFICGWFLTLGYISIVALNASALALLAKFVLPSFGNWGTMYHVAGWGVSFTEVVIASLALLIFGYLNIRGSGVSGGTQFIFCICLIAAVILVTAGMTFHPSSSISNLQPLFKPGVSVWSAVFAIVAVAPWAFVGFDNIPQAAEEFDFPAKKAFSLIVMSIICAALTYAVMIYSTGIAMPWKKLVAKHSLWGTGDVVQGDFGHLGLIVLCIAVIMGIFTGLIGFFVSSSRLMFAMSRAKILPDFFSKLHPKYGTPYAGIMVTTLLCLAAPWFGRGVLQWIVDMSSLGVAVAYFYTCLAAYKFFRWSNKRTERSEERNGVKIVCSPLKKLLCLLGTISSVFFIGLLVVPGSPACLGLPSWIILVVWSLLGAAFYLFKRKELNKIPKEKLDYLILGETLTDMTDEEEIDDDAVGFTHDMSS
ncbi:APC family permease [Scopulibacillus cellulosilyticus]|uniref:APC family permease n=1 Tax=Scopulibacillus cellulosilyticus TaxID=2665665 RepID=A0ABW2PV08_9BACL